MHFTRPLCSLGLSLGLTLPSLGAHAQAPSPPATDEAPDATTQAAPAAKPRSPWLFVPLLSSNPKLGTSLGLMTGYVRKLDATSEPSMLALQLQYSNTSSRTYGLGGKAFWNDNADQMQFGMGGGNVSNDYLDFMGTGQEVRSDETLRGYFLRYQHRLRPHWFAGAQAAYSNYGVEGSDPTSDQILDLAGLAGSTSAGLGLIVSFDTRDNTNNPTSGMLAQLHNFAFRDGFGSDDDYDQVTGEVKWYRRTSARNVLVLHGKWRWTDDAPESKKSTVGLRGYTRGQYLGRNALSFEIEDRYMFRPRWGAKAFAGVACLYGDGENCSGDNAYPMAGAGVFFVLKPESNMVVSGEFAKGNGDNRGVYLTFGHRF